MGVLVDGTVIGNFNVSGNIRIANNKGVCWGSNTQYCGIQQTTEYNLQLWSDQNGTFEFTKPGVAFNLKLGSNSIDVNVPTESGTLATHEWTSGSYLPLSGGRLTGKLHFNAFTDGQAIEFDTPTGKATIGADNGISGLYIKSQVSEHNNDRGFEINDIDGGHWTVCMFGDNSFPHGNYRYIASEEWTSANYLPLIGGTLSGSTTFNAISTFNSHLNVYNSVLTMNAGLIKTSTSAIGAIIGSNGIAFSSPGTVNDGGWLRVTGTAENDTILELGTGDDGGAGDSIHFRGYNTGNGITYDVTVPKSTGILALANDIGKGTINITQNTKSLASFNVNQTNNTDIALNAFNIIYNTGSDAGSLSSYWFPIWKRTQDIAIFNDFNYVISLANQYAGVWGIIAFSFRRNNQPDYNYTVTLKRLCGNVDLSNIRLYYNNTSGDIQLWCNTQAQYAFYTGYVLSMSTRTTTVYNDYYGSFVNQNFSSAQTLPGSDYLYISMSDGNAYLPLSGGIINGGLYFQVKSIGSNYIIQDADTSSGLQIGTRSYARNKREFNIARPGVESTRTSCAFNHETSFPYTSRRNVASEEWVSSTFLPLSGGTLTGTLYFKDVGGSGATGTAPGLYWSGSTDNASITYTVPSSDQGILQFSLGDDSNTYFQFVQNGTELASIKSDGIYENNVKLSSKYAAISHTHNSGIVAAETGTNNIAVRGLSMAQAYNNGYPTSYGNVLRMGGGGETELLLGLSGTSGANEKMYYRSQRDTADANWSSWDTVASERWTRDLMSGGTSTSTDTYVRSYVQIDSNNKAYVDVPISISTDATNVKITIGSKSITISQSADEAGPLQVTTN